MMIVVDSDCFNRQELQSGGTGMLPIGAGSPGVWRPRHCHPGVWFEYACVCVCVQ